MRHPRLNVFVNVGRTHTKGMNYRLASEDTADLEGKTLLIYDVPAYFGEAQANRMPSNRIKTLKIKQYPGFLIDLSRYGDLEAYMADTFGRKSRNKLRRDRRRLEACFEMEYRFFCGDIPGEEHDSLFQVFRGMMEKRYNEKGETNNNLDPAEWEFYKEVSLQMIREEKAALLVIYAQGKPVGILLNYLTADILFQAITVFDTDYSHFNIGTTGFLQLIDWCLQRGIKTLDFSKGYYPYKAAWGTQRYHFEYHILFDRNSPVAWLRAQVLALGFRIKQGLRELKLNTLLHRAVYRFRTGSPRDNHSSYSYSFEEPSGAQTPEKEPLDPEASENAYLRRGLMDFLYFNHEHYRDARMYRIREQAGRFLIKGRSSTKIMDVISA